MSPDAPAARAVRRGSQGDLGFRLGTGVFAVLVVAIVVGIGVVLTSESWLSIQKFGLGFWKTTTWDPVAGDFGALPFIWGTLYSAILALLLYENPKDKAQSKAMVEFVKWALSDGQKFAPELGYAPLPAEVVKLELAALAKIRVS